MEGVCVTIRKYCLKILSGFLLLGASATYAADPLDEPEIQVQKASVRSIGRLAISQAEGIIHLRGWPQSKIEVHFSPATPGEIAPTLEKTEYGFRVGNSDSSQIIRGTTVIRAPRQMNLDILSKQSEIDVLNWSGDVLIRSGAGRVNLKSIRSASTQMICFECEFDVEDLKGSLVRITGGKGNVGVDQVSAEEVYFETESGDMTLRNTQGAHVLVSNQGHITAEKSEGSVYFKTRQGEINFTQMKALISGKTDQGNITVSFGEVPGEEQSYFYSDSGNVTLGFPEGFSESVETVWNGKPIESELPEWQPTPPKIVRWVSGLFKKWAKMDTSTDNQIEGKFFGFKPGRAPIIRVKTRKGQVRLLASNQDY